MKKDRVVSYRVRVIWPGNITNSFPSLALVSQESQAYLHETKRICYMRPVLALGIATIMVIVSTVVTPPSAEAKHGWKNGNKHFWKQQRRFNRFASGRGCGNGPPPWAASNFVGQGPPPWAGSNNWDNSNGRFFNGRNPYFYGSPSPVQDLRWQFLGF